MKSKLLILATHALVSYSQEGYFSSAGQDKFLDYIVFQGKENGTYIDIGPKQIKSNTKFFKKVKSWKKEIISGNSQSIDLVNITATLNWRNILESLNFENLNITAIIIRSSQENDRQKIREKLTPKQFHLLNSIKIAGMAISDVTDEIYVNSRFFKKPTLKNEIKNPISLITTMFLETDPERIEEYQKCFKKNIQNELITKIYVFCENVGPKEFSFLDHKKIECIPIKSRPTFKSIIEFANNNLKDNIAAICNTDIYFDETISKIRQVDFNQSVVMLTRHNIAEYKGTWKRHPYSYDTYIFRAPLKVENADFFLGQHGCDLCISDRCTKAGYNVLNPSVSIKTWHEHKTEENRESLKIDRISTPFREILKIAYNFLKLEELS